MSDAEARTADLVGTVEGMAEQVVNMAVAIAAVTWVGTAVAVAQTVDKQQVVMCKAHIHLQ